MRYGVFFLCLRSVCLIPLPSAGATENVSQLVIETPNRERA
nr:MAG TPA: hypothetical protein [Caudoviricetes sp.]